MTSSPRRSARARRSWRHGHGRRGQPWQRRPGSAGGGGFHRGGRLVVCAEGFGCGSGGIPPLLTAPRRVERIAADAPGESGPPRCSYVRRGHPDPSPRSSSLLPR